MNVKVEEILNVIKGSVTCMIGKGRKEFSSGKEALDQINGKYVVSSISANGDSVEITLEEDKTIPNDMNVDWVKEHIAQFGKESSPFDGV